LLRWIALGKGKSGQSAWTDPGTAGPQPSAIEGVILLAMPTAILAIVAYIVMLARRMKE
jgi:hypothetical protein